MAFRQHNQARPCVLLQAVEERTQMQVRADRMQSDLEELLKALTERCKKHGVDVKSTALIELPVGITFRKHNLFFDDSVPTKPLSRFGNSPTRFIEVSTDHFGSFLRFDSFNIHDSGFLSQPERLSRFDSVNSTKDFGGPDKLSRFDSISSSKDFGNSSGFYSFDDSDPFGSSSPFKVSLDSN